MNKVGNSGSSHYFDFLPVNQSRSPPHIKRRRGYMSCDLCCSRKARCDLSEENLDTCKRCIRERKECTFTRIRKKRKPNSAAGLQAEPRRSSDFNDTLESQTRESVYNGQTPASDFSRPASGYAPEQERGSRLDSAASLNRDDVARYSAPQERSTIPEVFPAVAEIPNAKTKIMSSQLHNTSDALDLLTFAASEEQPFKKSQDSNAQGTCPSIFGGGESSCGNGSRTIGTPQPGWNNFLLIKRGIVTKDEIVEYLNFFFEILWPLQPVIPSYYHLPIRYVQLAAEEPVLLTTLVAISSRYHHLLGGHGEIRSERIHWRTWSWVQKYLQSAMWGSACTRTLGTIASMLLLIHWHCKAINSPTDFTEEVEISDADNFGTPFQQNSDPNGSSGLTSKQRHRMTLLLEKLNIVAPAYRSHKMSWMMLSNAIALAQEGCCFETENQGPTSYTENISEYSRAKQEWNHTLCVFIYLADESLAMRLGLDTQLPERQRQVVRDRFSNVFSSSLRDIDLWESFFDLAAELTKARKLLSTLKQSNSNYRSDNIIPVLEQMKRSLDRWKRQQEFLMKTTDVFPLSRICIDLEYHYARLFIFAPAAHALHSTTASGSSEPDYTEPHVNVLSWFADDTKTTSSNLLHVVIKTQETSNLLRYLPVRYWLFIVSASLHLLKEILTRNVNPDCLDPDIQLLVATVRALREGSPDDTHMAQRFARFLEIVMNASLRASLGDPGDRMRPDGYKGIPINPQTPSESTFPPPPASRTATITETAGDAWGNEFGLPDDLAICWDELSKLNWMVNVPLSDSLTL